MMKLFILLLFTISCLEVDPNNHDSDLAGTKRHDIYVKTVLSDFGVRKHVTGIDNKYPTALYYLSYQPVPLKDDDKGVKLTRKNYPTNTQFKFNNIVLSYQRQKDEKDETITTFTCHLQNRAFASETAITESASCFEGEAAYLFARMCAEQKGFVLGESGRDFICDLSDDDCADGDNDCRIHVNADCIADKNSSYGDACTAIQALWKDKQGIEFVEAVRAAYSSCEYKSSQLNCTANSEGDDDGGTEG